jgi:hypothetical protein
VSSSRRERKRMDRTCHFHLFDIVFVYQNFPGTFYKVEIRAHNSIGNSPPSTVYVRTALPPSGSSFISFNLLVFISTILYIANILCNLLQWSMDHRQNSKAERLFFSFQFSFLYICFLRSSSFSSYCTKVLTDFEKLLLS